MVLFARTGGQAPAGPCNTKRGAEIKMPELSAWSRVLCDHQRDTPEDWVAKLDQLADLSDEQIQNLVRMSAMGRTAR